MIEIIALQSHFFSHIKKGDRLLTLEGISSPSQLGIALSAIRKNYPINIEARKNSKLLGKATNSSRCKAVDLTVNVELYWRL